MKTLVPPQPPVLVGLGDDGGNRRLRLRLHQITLSTITILATAWCITLGTVQVNPTLAGDVFNFALPTGAQVIAR